MIDQRMSTRPAAVVLDHLPGADGRTLGDEADIPGLSDAEAWNQPAAGAPRREYSQGCRKARLSLRPYRSGDVLCDGSCGRNPSVSDISHEFVRRRFPVAPTPS